MTPDFGSGYGNFDITSGLTNGTSYAVRVRGVSDNSGNGADP